MHKSKTAVQVRLGEVREGPGCPEARELAMAANKPKIGRKEGVHSNC